LEHQSRDQGACRGALGIAIYRRCQCERLSSAHLITTSLPLRFTVPQYDRRLPTIMNKIILITGASRGIGAATARMAARRGHSVCVNYRENRRAADAVVHDITAMGGRAVAIGADVSIEAEVKRLFESCDDLLGPLTALV